MALSDPVINFGIHSITPYARSSRTVGGTTYEKGQPFGIFRVIGDATFSMNTSSAQLYGGSSYYAWASEVTQVDAELAITLKEYPAMLYDLFAAATVTSTASSATGTISNAITNTKGTSVVDASTGIASVDLKSGEASELKFGWYAVVAASATTVDVYALTNQDFNDGTAINYQDDALKITSSPLTITASGTTEVTDTGVELTGGSGTIGMTSGDVAIYHVTPAHGGIDTIDIGREGNTFPEIGLILTGKERSSGSKFELQAFKAQATSGISVPMTEGDFGTSDVTFKVLQDSSPIDGTSPSKIVTIRQIKPA